MGHILDRIPNACLAIVGDGPQRPELERLFAGRNVNFVGYLTGAELAAAYASADAFVYASETETMGNVVLEALACGCAVVAPDAGGIPSLVEPGKTAILYPPGRVDEAARAVHKILNEPAFRSQLGRQARQAVETWTWCHSIEQVRAIYSEAISRQRPPADWTVGHRLSRATLSILVSSFRAISAIYRRETSLPASEKPLAI